MWRKTNLIKTQEKNTVQCQRVKFSRNNNFLKTKKRGFNWATELHKVQFAINETPTEVFDYYNLLRCTLRKELLEEVGKA